MIRTSLVVWLLLAFGSGIGEAAEPAEDYCRKRRLIDEAAGLTSYEKRQKYGMNGMYIYIKDEGFWSYTPWFRESFGMPCDWVDPDLKGAAGVTLYFSRTAGNWRSNRSPITRRAKESWCGSISRPTLEC